MAFLSSSAPASVRSGSIFSREPRLCFAPLDIALFFAFLAMALPLGQAARMFYDPDTLWHVYFGQELLRTGEFPRVDSASFTAAGLPWITKEWLSQILLASAHAAGGWTAITFLILGCIGATMVIVGLPLARRLPPLVAALILAGLPSFWTAHLLARPHVLAFPVIALWTVLLVRAADRFEAPHPAAALLMIVWANLHGGFTLGLLLAGGLGAEAILHAPAERRAKLIKDWGIFLTLSFLAALCTPFGIDSLLVTQKIFALGPYLTSIIEWKPFSFQDDPIAGVFLLGGIGAILLARPRLRAARIGLILFILYLAMTYNRNIELLALILPTLLLSGLAARLPEKAGGSQAPLTTRRPGIISLIAATILFSGTILWLQPAPPENNRPEAALAFARRHGLDREPVFNYYGFGGYLVTQGLPTFIDGRAELFPITVHEDYHTAAFLKGDPEQIFTKYKIGWILIETSSPLRYALELGSGWKTVYQDKVASILVRSGRDLPAISR